MMHKTTPAHPISTQELAFLRGEPTGDFELQYEPPEPPVFDSRWSPTVGSEYAHEDVSGVWEPATFSVGELLLFVVLGGVGLLLWWLILGFAVRGLEVIGGWR